MKTKIFILLFFIGIFACKESNEIEIIPDYDQIYLSSKKVDKPAKFTSDTKESLNKIAIKVAEKNNLTEAFQKDRKAQLLYYELYIGEDGNIERIKIRSGFGGEYDSRFISAMKSWRFEPALNEGKKVKSVYDLILAVYYDKDKDVFTFNDQAAPPPPPFDLKYNEEMFALKVDSSPEPVGGMSAIARNVVYPEVAKKAGIQGKVFLKAFIDENGNVLKADVIKGIGAGCDEAAINAVMKTKFKPGIQNGKPVKVQLAIPIVFKLQ